MSKMVQSSVIAGGVGLLVLIALFNSAQLHNLESQLVDTQKRLSSLEQRISAGVPVVGGGGGGGGSGASSALPGCQDSADNLLRCPTRPRVKAQTVVPGQTLRMQIGSDPRGLNPYVANGADVAEYNLYIGDQLAERAFENPDIFEPGLATKITTTDNLTYRVHLREGVWWHLPVVDWSSGRYEWLKGPGPEGRRPFTADDVAFTLEVIKNPQTSGRVSSIRNYFEKLESWKVIDPYTIEVRFSEVLATNVPALFETVPLPRFLYQYDADGNRFDESTWGLKFNEHWYNQKGIGTGPYQFVTWEQGVKIELQKNPYYWGEPASFERIQMQIVSDQQAWVRKLKTGELDFTQIQPEQFKTEIKDVQAKGGSVYLGDPRIQYTTHPTLGYFYLGWNLDRPVFADKRVRQALTMALDRQGIVDNIFHGNGKITSGPFGSQQPCYDQSIQPWPYDLARARALLEEAGWTDSNGDGVRDKLIDGKRVDFRFTLMIYGSSNEWETLASIYREALLSIGVQMTPTAVEWSTMLKRMDERDFDVYSGAWVLGWDTDLMQIWHSQEADRAQSSNRIGFRNKEADRIAETLRRTLDPQERVRICHEFHALVHEEQPYTFIYERTRPVLYWNWMNELEFAKTYPERDLRHFSFRAEPGR